MVLIFFLPVLAVALGLFLLTLFGVVILLINPTRLVDLLRWFSISYLDLLFWCFLSTHITIIIPTGAAEVSSLTVIQKPLSCLF